MIKLVIRSEGRPPTEQMFQGNQVSIGRVEGNDLVLATNGVSSHHCRIIKVGGTYEIEDTGSTNGTYVNSIRVKGRRSITAQDEVIIANFTLFLVAEQPQGQPLVSRGTDAGKPTGKTLATQIMQVGPQGFVPNPEMQRAAAFANQAAQIHSDSSDVSTSPFVPTNNEAPSRGSRPTYSAPGLGSLAQYHGGGATNPNGGAAGSFDGSPGSFTKPPRTVAGSAVSHFPPPGQAPQPAGPPPGQVAAPFPPPFNPQPGYPPAAQPGYPPAQPGYAPAPQQPQAAASWVAGPRSVPQDSLGATRDPDAALRDPFAARMYDLVDPMAQSWSQQGRPASLLIGGEELKEAQRWSASGVGGPYPRPQVVHREYVEASLKLARKQKLKLLIWPVAGLFVLGGSVVAAKLILGDSAVDEKVDVEKKNTESAGQAGSLIERSSQLAARAVELAEKDPDLAVLLATEAVRLSEKAQEPGIGQAEQTLRKLLGAAQSQTLAGHDGAIRRVIIDSAGSLVIAGASDGSIRVWDLASPAKVRIFSGHSDAVNALVLSQDGRWLASASDDRTARIWDLTQSDPASTSIALRGHLGRVTELAIAPDASWLATAGADPEIRVWNLRVADPNTDVAVVKAHEGAITSLAVVQSGKALASAGTDHKVAFHTLRGGKPTKPASKVDVGASAIVALRESEKNKVLFALGDAGVVARISLSKSLTREPEVAILDGLRDDGVDLAMSSDGERLAIAGDRKRLLLWQASASDPSAVAQAKTLESDIQSLAMSDDGSLIAVGSQADRIELWNLAAKDESASMSTLTGHRGPVRAVAVAPHARFIASGGDDKTVRVWDPAAAHGGVAAIVGRAHDERVGAIALNRDATRAVSGGADGVVILWSIGSDGSLVPLRRFTGPKGRVSGVALAHDDKWLVASSQDGVMRLWNLRESDAAPIEITQHSAEIYALGISADERWLITAGSDHEVYIWPFGSDGPGEPQRLAGHSQPVLTLAFSQEGRWVASAGQDKSVNVWDMSPGLKEAKGKRLRGHDATIWALAISPDGKRLVSAGEDRQIHLRSLDNLDAPPVILRGHQEAIRHLAFSPDGKRLASGSDDKTIRIWDIASEHPEEGSRVYADLAASVSSLAFDPKLPRLYSSTNNGAVQIWDMTDDRQAAESISMPGHDGVVIGMQVAQKGGFFLTGGWDHTIRLWPADAAWLGHTACRFAGRNMTQAEWSQHVEGFAYHQTCPNL